MFLLTTYMVSRSRLHVTFHAIAEVEACFGRSERVKQFSVYVGGSCKEALCDGCRSVVRVHRVYLWIKAHLLENHNLVGCLQVLQLVGDQDARFFLQHATDAPETDIVFQH